MRGRARQRKLERAAERDIFEQIAICMQTKTTTAGEGLFDARLFNQSTGMDSGINDDKNYGVYDQPWRKEDHLYRQVWQEL